MGHVLVVVILASFARQLDSAQLHHGGQLTPLAPARCCSTSLRKKSCEHAATRKKEPGPELGLKAWLPTAVVSNRTRRQLQATTAWLVDKRHQVLSSVFAMPVSDSRLLSRADIIRFLAAG